MLLLTLSCFLLVTMTTAEVGEDDPISPSDQDWLNSLFYLPETPRKRQEYRMLTQEERDRFNGAFLKLKQDKSVTPNKYDLLVSLHSRRSSRNSAHGGPGFLGWHRVFVLLMENALREKEPNITMAYWDSTIDAALPQPRESCLWSEDFMGNGDGFVNAGVFKGWTTQEDKLYRTVGIMNGPLGEKNISRLFRFHHIGNISYPNTVRKDPEDILELTHNRVHRWIGGEMKLIESAADDPFFFIYHSFISFIWERFRGHQRSMGIDPETDWDMFYGSARNHKYAPMGLGNLMAIDGSSEIFAENIVFEKRPSCSRGNTDCGSPYLYCNITIEMCVTWTVLEYDAIKRNAASKNITFVVEANEHIEMKLSAVLDTVTDEETDKKNVGEMGHDHSHGHSHNDNDEMKHQQETNAHSHGDDDVYDAPADHGDHDHKHKYNTAKETHIYHHGHASHNFIQRYLPMILFAGTILFLIVLSVTSKCSEEKQRDGTSKGTYRMDGIINVNYTDSERVKYDDKHDQPSEPRTDNIYTITVTSNAGTPGTFVRFAKYENQQEQETNSQEHSCIAPVTVIASRGDYLDMDYASRILNEAESCDSDLYEISLESDPEHAANDDFEIEPTYSSIENENFDLACLHAGSEPCDQQCCDNATKSIDDVLAEYDNVVFRTEAMGYSTGTAPNLDMADISFEESHGPYSGVPSSYT